MVSCCEENLTLLRYLDLSEASKFILFVEENKLIKTSAKISRNFLSPGEINMQSIKLHYLKTLKNVIPEAWSDIFTHFSETRVKKIQHNNTIDPKGVSQSVFKCASNKSLEVPLGTSAIYVTTKDAYTLTDGPTIFLATDVTKIAKFCIQQANIPSGVMNEIQDKIDFNNIIIDKIASIESEIEDSQDQDTNKSDSKSDSKKKEKVAGEMIDKSKDSEIIKMKEQLTLLSEMIKSATLNDLFIPNRNAHKEKWSPNAVANTFTSDVGEDDIISIMTLKDVDDSWKVLLLLGIGVFTQHKSSAYTEIMKRLADSQKLYLIIADSDYIYGTNYQFCHGYLSKDLDLTQEKLIQAMGRIGRNKVQQDYTVRFRDDEQIHRLFTADADKPEILNMNRLFNGVVL